MEAANGGHHDLVTDMINRGADSYENIAAWAANEGRVDIVIDIINRGSATTIISLCLQLGEVITTW